MIHDSLHHCSAQTIGYTDLNTYGVISIIRSNVETGLVSAQTGVAINLLRGS